MNERDRLIKQAEETFGLKAVPHEEKPNLSPLENQLAKVLIDAIKDRAFTSAFHAGHFLPNCHAHAKRHWRSCASEEEKAALTAAGYLNEEENE